MINRAWNRSASFRLIQWLKIIPHMIRSFYCCCCINEPVIFSVHHKLGQRFHALLKVCPDCDDTVPCKGQRTPYNFKGSDHNLKVCWGLGTSRWAAANSKKEVACIASKPLSFLLAGDVENPQKLNIQEVQGALSSRPNGDPCLLPTFQDFFTFVKSHLWHKFAFISKVTKAKASFPECR